MMPGLVNIIWVIWVGYAHIILSKPLRSQCAAGEVVVVSAVLAGLIAAATGGLGAAGGAGGADGPAMGSVTEGVGRKWCRCCSAHGPWLY